MTGLVSRSSQALRVVVADDSAFMRRVLSDALSGEGFEVLAAVENGDEALKACRALNPDVLTLDLAMPGLGGIGVLRALRTETSPIPVVVVSAFSPAQGAHAVDALAEGAVDLVAKPGGGESLNELLIDLRTKARLAAALRRTRPAISDRPSPSSSEPA